MIESTGTIPLIWRLRFWWRTKILRENPIVGVLGHWEGVEFIDDAVIDETLKGPTHGG